MRHARPARVGAGPAAPSERAGHGCTRDRQQDQRCNTKQQDGRPDFTDDPLGDRFEPGYLTVFLVRHPRRRDPEWHARFQSADGTVEREGTPGTGFDGVPGIDSPQLRVERIGEFEGRRQHANHEVGAWTPLAGVPGREGQVTPDNSRVGCERSAPQRVTEDDEIQISCGLIVREKTRPSEAETPSTRKKFDVTMPALSRSARSSRTEINRRLPAAIPEFDDREIAERLRG